MHCTGRFLSVMIRDNKLKVTDLQNNYNRDLNTCSHVRVNISKEKILYMLQQTSKMQFYICVSVILVYTLLFHTHTEASVGRKLVPANPSKCSSEVTTSPLVLRDLTKFLIYGCSNCGEIRKLCIKYKNFTVIKLVRRTIYC